MPKSARVIPLIAPKRKIFITKTDLERLTPMLSSARRFLKGVPHLDILNEGLRGAEIVAAEALPTDVVTVDSTVRVTEFHRERKQVYVLVFPCEVIDDEHHVSVLSPVGAALLGARAGDVVLTPGPNGERRLRIDSVTPKPPPQPPAPVTRDSKQGG